MASSHAFLLNDVAGRRLGPLGYESASYTMSANAPATLSLSLPLGVGADIDEGQIVEVWRTPGAPVPLWPQDEYIVTNVKRNVTASGNVFYAVDAQDMLWVLSGYVNRYGSNNWMGAADDYMRAVFRGNFMSDGPSDGNISAAARARSLMFSMNVKCEPDMGVGPKIKTTSPGGQVLSVLQATAKKAMVPDGYPSITGRPLFFDMYAHQRNPLGFTFAVFADQRGRDLTTHTPVILSVNRELMKVEIEQDFASEVNAVFYKTGATTRVRVDTARSLRGPLARREGSAGAVMDATTALREGIPPYQIRASLVDTANGVYGRDYSWGDAVLVNTGGQLLPMRLDTVSITLDAAGNEQKSGRLNLIM